MLTGYAAGMKTDSAYERLDIAWAKRVHKALEGIYRIDGFEPWIQPALRDAVDSLRWDGEELWYKLGIERRGAGIADAQAKYPYTKNGFREVLGALMFAHALPMVDDGKHIRFAAKDYISLLEQLGMKGAFGGIFAKAGIDINKIQVRNGTVTLSEAESVLVRGFMGGTAITRPADANVAERLQRHDLVTMDAVQQERYRRIMPEVYSQIKDVWRAHHPSMLTHSPDALEHLLLSDRTPVEQGFARKMMFSDRTGIHQAAFRQALEFDWKKRFMRFDALEPDDHVQLSNYVTQNYEAAASMMHKFIHARMAVAALPFEVHTQITGEGPQFHREPVWSVDPMALTKAMAAIPGVGSQKAFFVAAGLQREAIDEISGIDGAYASPGETRVVIHGAEAIARLQALGAHAVQQEQVFEVPIRVFDRHRLGRTEITAGDKVLDMKEWAARLKHKREKRAANAAEHAK